MKFILDYIQQSGRARQIPSLTFYVDDQFAGDKDEVKKLGLALQQIRPLLTGVSVHSFRKDQNNQYQVVLQYPAVASGKVSVKLQLIPAAPSSINPNQYSLSNIGSSESSTLDFFGIDTLTANGTINHRWFEKQVTVELPNRRTAAIPHASYDITVASAAAKNTIAELNEELMTLNSSINYYGAKLSQLKNSVIKASQESLDLANKTHTQDFLDTEIASLTATYEEHFASYASLKSELDTINDHTDLVTKKLLGASDDNLKSYTLEVNPARIALLNVLQLTAIEAYEELLKQLPINLDQRSKDKVNSFNLKFKDLATITTHSSNDGATHFNLHLKPNFNNISIHKIVNHINAFTKYKIKRPQATKILYKHLSALPPTIQSAFVWDRKKENYFDWTPSFKAKINPSVPVNDVAELNAVVALQTDFKKRLEKNIAAQRQSDVTIQQAAHRFNQYQQDVERQRLLLVQTKRDIGLLLASADSDIKEVEKIYAATNTQMTEYVQAQRNNGQDGLVQKLSDALAQLQTDLGLVKSSEATILGYQSQIESLSTQAKANDLLADTKVLVANIHQQRDNFHRSKAIVTQEHSACMNTVVKRKHSLTHQEVVINSLKELMSIINNVTYWHSKVSFYPDTKVYDYAQKKSLAVPKGVFEMHNALRGVNTDTVSYEVALEKLSAISEIADKASQRTSTWCCINLRKEATERFYDAVSGLDPKTLQAPITSQFAFLTQDGLKQQVNQNKVADSSAQAQPVAPKPRVK